MSIDDIIRLATELPSLGVAKICVGDVRIEFGASQADEPGWDDEAEAPDDLLTDEQLKFHSAGY